MEAARRKNMRGLISDNIGDVFNHGYYASSNGIKDFYFLFFENVIKNIIHRRVLDETISQSFKRRSGSDAFMEAFIIGIVKHLGLVVPAAAFVKQRATNRVEEELKQMPTVMEEIPSPSNRYTSASADSISDEESKARRLHHKRHFWKDQRYCDISVESRDKQTKHQIFSSPCSQAESSLKTPAYKSSGSSLRSTSRSGD